MRGHAHREGGLGHLSAVVRDAPAEAARDAAAVVLLLAAHHRLHGVAAHPDGSLQPEGTGHSTSPPPHGANDPQPPPQPQVPPSAHQSVTCLVLAPRASVPQQQPPRAASSHRSAQPGTSHPSGSRTATTRSASPPTAAMAPGAAATSPGALPPARRPASPAEPGSRSGDPSRVVRQRSEADPRNPPRTRRGQVLRGASCPARCLHLSIPPRSIPRAGGFTATQTHFSASASVCWTNTFSLNLCCCWSGLPIPAGDPRTSCAVLSPRQPQTPCSLPPSPLPTSSPLPQSSHQPRSLGLWTRFSRTALA